MTLGKILLIGAAATLASFIGAADASAQQGPGDRREDVRDRREDRRDRREDTRDRSEDRRDRREDRRDRRR